MRSKAAAIALAIAFSTTLTSAAVFMPQEAQAQNQRGYDMFYNDLAQDGRWIEHPRYGWAWYPTRVRDDWRPYSDGQWRWTDRHGWYWDSNERFGWATYHYGRWGYDDQYGHIWVPGDEWAPAWVSFRDSDEAIGWAPLPPETLGMTLLALLAGGNSSSHYRYVDMSDSYYQPRWTFVPTRNFTDDRVYTHAYAWRDNDRYYRGSRNVTNYAQVNNYYVNRSIDPRRWESRTGRQVQTVNVREANSGDQWRDRDRRDERNISVFHPRIERDRDGRSAPPPAVRATANDKPVMRVQREWTAPEERRDRPNTRDEWRQRYSQGNDRNDRDGNDRDRDGRPNTTAKPGGVAPATPTDRVGQQPDHNRTDGDRNRTPQQRAEQDRAQQQKAQQEKMQQDRAQQLKAQQDKAAQERTQQQKAAQERVQQQKAQQDKAAQDRAQQQKAAQERAQQQKAQQDKAHQERAQQQKATQQRQQQEKVQQQKAAQDKAAQEKAQRARQPEQATKPEPRQPEQRQQPQRGKPEQRGTECPPNQPHCR